MSGETVITRVRERIGLKVLRRLKASSKKYYVTIEPDIIGSYSLLPGDILKIELIEVLKEREHPAEDVKLKEKRGQEQLTF